MSNDTPNPSVIRIPLTQGLFALVDECDCDLVGTNWYAHRSRNTTYARTNVERSVSINMHRVILSRKLGRELGSAELCDHIDGDGLNNTRANLRLDASGQNQRNARLRRDNKTGYKGVTDHSPGKWRASIRVNNKTIHLGIFASKEEAAQCYNDGALKYFGEFARLNTIPDSRLTNSDAKMNETDMRRLLAAELHGVTPDLYAIQISNTVLGSKALTLEGFTLVIGRYEDHWMCVWRSNNPYIKNAHDVAVCEALLQRAKEIMGGGA